MNPHAVLTNQFSPARPGGAMNRLEYDITLAVQSASPVLLTGFSDATQALAYRIHSESGWRHGPFMVVDCGSPDAAFEKALFKAVFPADPRPPRGELRLQLSQPGTVLLQEVGRLALPIQERLAERLTEITTGRPPGRSCRRVIASTSEQLLDRVRAGTFDDRLYYRLNVIHMLAVLPDD